MTMPYMYGKSRKMYLCITDCGHKFVHLFNDFVVK